MKTNYLIKLGVISGLICGVNAQVNNSNYTNFIRQVQLPVMSDGSHIQMDVSVPAAGQIWSPLEINPTGARFELHTVSAVPFASRLIDTRYVGSYVPLAELNIRTEDINSAIVRTRADRPFYVDYSVSGLYPAADTTAPASAKSVKFYHHIQSYGAGGDGVNTDRTQATLSSQVYVNENKSETLTYALTIVPGADRAKVRGEERFSIFTLDDYQAPESQLASKTVQIWPVADGTISGITDGETIEFATPTLTIAANDIYPDARIYAQIYKGNKRDDGFVGSVVPGSAVAVQEAVPQNRLLSVTDWDSVLTENGIWTMELLTFTPFGIDRLDWVTFNVDRTISVRATATKAN
ncbi:MAG: hypothetical protein ACK5JP_04025 [Akkermansiaceae bacterium]|jgi:hypothetical protein